MKQLLYMVTISCILMACEKQPTPDEEHHDFWCNFYDTCTSENPMKDLYGTTESCDIYGNC